jgi:hypothetical protein
VEVSFWVAPQWRVENPAERVGSNAATRFAVASGSAGTVVASSRADDQRVLLRASKLLHHVLARQRLPHRPECFLIHEPHRTPARGVLRATAAVVRAFARTRVSRIAGVQRAVCATDDVDEVHALIVADPRTTTEIPAQNRSLPGQIGPEGDLATDAHATMGTLKSETTRPHAHTRRRDPYRDRPPDDGSGPGVRIR